MIPIQLQLMPAPPEPIAFAANLEHLAALIEQLEAKGVAVKFIEMPTDPSLAGSAYAQATRIALQDRFPPERYPRLAIFNDAVYQWMVCTSRRMMPFWRRTRFVTCSRGLIRLHSAISD
jgi:hypothetical protein